MLAPVGLVAFNKASANCAIGTHLTSRDGWAFLSVDRTAYGHARRLRRPGTNLTFVVP